MYKSIQYKQILSIYNWTGLYVHSKVVNQFYRSTNESTNHRIIFRKFCESISKKGTTKQLNIYRENNN